MVCRLTSCAKISHLRVRGALARWSKRLPANVHRLKPVHCDAPGQLLEAVKRNARNLEPQSIVNKLTQEKFSAIV